MEDTRKPKIFAAGVEGTIAEGDSASAKPTFATPRAPLEGEGRTTKAEADGLNAPEPELFEETAKQFQNSKGISITLSPERDDKLTPFGKSTLTDRYTANESYQELFARVAAHFADDTKHAQRLYDYISQLWFMPSTPVLSNGGLERGLPISCFLNEASDSLQGIVDLWVENVWLASQGGGIGSYWGNLRSIGEKVGANGKTSGIIPFIRVMDSLTLAISQGSLRRGSAAIYLPLDHPEIVEFIELRRLTGGDHNRKALNLHHGVVVPDAFMRACETDEEWALKSPFDGHIVKTVSARDLWIRLLTARMETGEPYLVFIDQANKALPDFQKAQGLSVKMSNLCSEILLPTGPDLHGKNRTAVCCLSSLNLEQWDAWKDNPDIVEDIMRFLDNVLSDFIAKAPDSMERARYAATRERSVGLGVMGFHSLLQKQGLPFESAVAKSLNKKIFRQIREQADAASQKLATERGPCPDAAEMGVNERFAHKLAVAPTASISIICGGVSPGIEPVVANAFTHKTLSGSHPIQNPHLTRLLEAKGQNTLETWSRIIRDAGSVRTLEFLTDDEKNIFKTAFEIDQRWLIDFAADRTPYICQSQSLNIFLPSDVHKRDLHQIHYSAWKKGIKSLYYCRSNTLQRAEGSFAKTATATATATAPDNNYEECLACE